jgi:cellulose synthase/poly-beta-1,6-N-acetylglucosamine synthase-like glycosyltransferase
MIVIAYFALFIGFIIVYHHLIYPLLLRLLAASKREVLPAESIDDADLPSIHLILPAFNEAAVIAQKIRNVAALDYPPDKLKITLIGDGCTDRTIAIATEVSAESSCANINLAIEEHSCNRGKIAVINQAVSQSTSDIIALSDISALINRNGLRIAARRFKNPGVGVVNSSYIFANYASEGEKAYWHYQSKVKQMESRTGSVIGAHGALYFFCRALFTELRADTINDDFVLPMTMVAKGYAAVHDENITAVELECAKADDNNQRRKRIGAGNLQQAYRLRRLLLPGVKGVAFNFLSGKVLRVLMPVCLILFYIASLILATEFVIFALLLAGQSVFYGLALFHHNSKCKQSNRIIDVIYYFAAGHWYSFVGMAEYLIRGRKFKV